MPEHNRFRLIGDPHITRKFTFGVPLERRGERENHLFDDFAVRLGVGIEPILVVVGDLLEKPVCSLDDLFRIHRIIDAAAQTFPDRSFYIMAGNHDISPERSRTNAFDMLALAFNPYPNVQFLRTPLVVDGIAMFPWEWDRTALQQLEDVKDQEFDVAIGHWDLAVYDENNTDHLCPAAELAIMGARHIYSGHWHIPGDYTVNGIKVSCTGSMQPMTHAEDPEGTMYVTMDYGDYINADPEDFTNKYIRVVADTNVEVEPPVDCLGFKIKRENSGQEAVGSVELEEFSVKKVLSEAFTKHNVTDEVRDYIRERVDVTN